MIACMAAFLQHALRLETSVFFQLSGTQIVSQAQPVNGSILLQMRIETVMLLALLLLPEVRGRFFCQFCYLLFNRDV